jgi:hypothetical protein
MDDQDYFDYLHSKRVKAQLKRRYGTETPSSIRDYWLK